MKMNTMTEVIDQFVRESSVSPDKESRIINIGEVSNIFTIGTDNGFYLTKENEVGEKSKFTRYKLLDNISSFAAEKISGPTIAVAVVANQEVYAAYTASPEKLKLEDFTKLDFRGALGGMSLIPYRVLITAFGGEVSLFVEFHDASGFTQQFMARLDETAPVNASYFRLASEFTEVTGNAAGRAARQFVDGVYTYGVFHAGNDSPYAGFASDAPQLIYTPCRNPFGRTPPSPIRLKTEANLEAICTLIRPDTKNPGTHLFAVGEGKLYIYPFESQTDWLQSPGMGAPALIAESDKLLNAKQIAAYLLADRLYIFIRTAGGDIHYTVADYSDHMTVKDNFLEPVSLMSDAVSFDVHDGKLSVFTKEEFIECTQNPVTGAFTMDRVCVGTELDTCSKFSAFSTRINIGKPEAEVRIDSENGEKMGFYADGYYYKTSKAILKSDSLGYVAIIQKAGGISPDCFTVTYGEETIFVNPAQAMQKKLLSMTDEEAFKNAVISDPFGNTTPLAPKAEKSSLAAAAAGMSALHNAAIGLIPGIKNPITNFANGVMMTITDKLISILPASITENPFTRFVSHVVSDITAAFKWIIGKAKELYDKTVGKVINFVIQKTQKVWKFIAEIGGKVISVVVDCVAKVAETIKNMLEMIGIPVGKILDFLKKALGLETTGRINTAIKNIASLSIDVLVEKVSEMKETSIDLLTDAVDKIEKWADINKSPGADYALANPFEGNQNNLLTDMGISLNGHNMYVFDLVKSAIMPEIMTPEVAISDKLKSAAEILLNDIKEIGTEIEKIPGYFKYIADEIKYLISNFNFDNLIGVMKKILGVAAVEFLNISRAVIKTIFDIVIEGIRAVWLAVSSPLHVPFLSEVLKLLGVGEFAMIDLLTYPTAFLAGAVNAQAKLFAGKELFDIDSLEEISKAKSITKLRDMGGVVYG